jgi:hypothetical protein
MARAVANYHNNPNEITKQAMSDVGWQDYQDAWRYRWHAEIVPVILLGAGVYAFRKLRYIPPQSI